MGVQIISATTLMVILLIPKLNSKILNNKIINVMRYYNTQTHKLNADLSCYAKPILL